MSQAIVMEVIELQRQAVRRNELPMWTIYDRPLDYPDKIVARMFLVGNGRQTATQYVLVGDALPFLRDIFSQAGLVVIPRDERDEPQIIETWV